MLNLDQILQKGPHFISLSCQFVIKSKKGDIYIYPVKEIQQGNKKIEFGPKHAKKVHFFFNFVVFVINKMNIRSKTCERNVKFGPNIAKGSTYYQFVRILFHAKNTALVNEIFSSSTRCPKRQQKG